MLKPNFERIPSELKVLAHWVVYKPRRGMPFDPKTGRIARVNDPSTWGSFQQAKQAILTGPFDRLGFVFAQQDPFVGVDLDACHDARTGKVSRWATQVLKCFGRTYTEASPSGDGLRLIVRARPSGLEGKRVWKPKFAEAYGSKSPELMLCSCGAALTITGRVIAGRDQIQPGERAIALVLEKCFPQTSVAARQPASYVPVDRRLLTRLLDECESSSDRSAKDFKLCGTAIAKRWCPDEVWQLVCRRSKFAERDRAYFDLTWRNAARLIQTAGASIDDPHRLAAIVRAQFPGLRRWRDDWWMFRLSRYTRVAESDMRANVTAIVKQEFDRCYGGNSSSDGTESVQRVTRQIVENVLLALDSECHLSAELEQPVWLCLTPPFPAEESIAAKSAIIHVPSGVSAVPTADLFTLNAVDYSFDATSECPRWMSFLSEIWPGDRAAQHLLQDWMGYLLLPDTGQQKILGLFGVKRSGKGTIARVIESLVGKNNVAAPTLNSLQRDFGMMPLLNKHVAIVGDVRLSNRSDLNVITERLLTISGEDPVTIDRKYKEPVTTRLRTRFVLISNELPHFPDSSATLPSRLLPLGLRRSWYGREDAQLGRKLLAELPGILNWAIVGWRRLKDRGRFELPPSSKAMLDHMEELASPVLTFVRDCCETTAASCVAKQRLYERWAIWCEQHGIHAGNSAVFGRNLKAAVPEITDVQPRIGGRQVRHYQGIAIRPRETGDAGKTQLLPQQAKRAVHTRRKPRGQRES